MLKYRPVGYSYFFDGMCGPRSETRTHVYGFFLPQKKFKNNNNKKKKKNLADLTFFFLFEIFANRDPWLRVFYIKND